MRFMRHRNVNAIEHELGTSIRLDRGISFPGDIKIGCTRAVWDSCSILDTARVDCRKMLTWSRSPHDGAWTTRRRRNHVF